MRVSIELDDPACKPETSMLARTAEVYLDGVKQHLVVTADDEEGFVKRYKTLANGLLYQNEQGYSETEIVKGQVTIKIRGEYLVCQ